MNVKVDTLLFFLDTDLNPTINLDSSKSTLLHLI